MHKSQPVHHQEEKSEDNKKLDEKKTSASSNFTLKFNKDTTILLVLIILVVISIFQTIKLSSLKAGVNPAPASVGSSGSAAPAGLDKLPSQVGGC